jgi:hypothetical protein
MLSSLLIISSLISLIGFLRKQIPITGPEWAQGGGARSPHFACAVIGGFIAPTGPVDGSTASPTVSKVGKKA